ncbi:hypothetical protein D3C86_1832140 [compost metagenome]
MICPLFQLFRRYGTGHLVLKSLQGIHHDDFFDLRAILFKEQFYQNITIDHWRILAQLLWGSDCP